ncbi:MAG TPA: Xaa-Pro peptidase family protein [Chloroflexota bacterium]|nr:Xaa-Pro peptidase family protein [Chloroflexota bacterium]
MDYAERRERLKRQLADQGETLLAISPGPDMLYLLGYHPMADERPCFLLLTPDRELLIVPELNAEQTAAHVQIPMKTYSDNAGPAAVLGEARRELNLDRVSTILVDGPMRADFAILLQQTVPGARLDVSTPLLSAMRMRKEPEEIDLLRANAAQADAAMGAAWSAIRPGVTELDVARAVGEAFDAAGAQRHGLGIVGSGPNGAFPHHATSDRVIQPGDAIVIDIGASSDKYNSDITRMAYVGEPTDEYLKVHETVDAAVRAAIAAAKPGVRAGAVDDAARQVITDAGYGEYFTHRVGHGIGLQGHEPPYMTASNDLPLEKGMTFSIEPGIYLPGKFGVRLEEIVVVTDDGVEVLSRLPREVHRVNP